MIQRDGDRMRVIGPANLANISQVLSDGMSLVRDGVTSVDLSEVTELDSSLLAATLAWIRQARESGRELRVEKLPAGLGTLSELYGVSALVGASSGQNC